MDSGAWMATVHMVTKSQTPLSEHKISVSIKRYITHLLPHCHRVPVLHPALPYPTLALPCHASLSQPS